jgi:serine protease Do
MKMTETLDKPPAPSGPPRIPPEPPFPTPPAKSGGGSRTVLIAIVVAIVVAVAVMFVLPLIFGANPVDVLSGKGNGQVQEIKTVEERVVKAGQEAVVEAATKALPSTVNIEVQLGNLGAGIGSGIIYSSDGYIITNNHVVEEATNVKVALQDGTTYDAEVVGTDPDMDLAVIKISATDLPVATLGTSSDLVPGELAVAVGSPEGFQGSVTSGIISALNRNIYVPNSAPLLDVIQTDAAINPGNSGGPLCNSMGDIIGINTAIYSQSGGYDGLGFAIPIDSAKPVIEELIDKGYATHPWLGFSGSTLDPDVAQSYNLPVDKGAIVRNVVQGAPADKAGLEAGDIIVAMDGTAIDSMDQLIMEIRKREIGDTVTIDYYRNSEKKQTKAVLEEKPKTTT